MTDLVKRLRAAPSVDPDTVLELCWEAADRIRELEAREEELVTMVETIRNNLHPRISELEDTIERVRKLPERYSGEIYWDCETGNEHCEETYVSKELIKEALADD